ncbi:7290_t:CDS:1, partial [Acaulospora morrowiae]
SFKGKEKEDASLVEITSDDGAAIQSTTMTQKEYNEMLDSADEDWKRNKCYNHMHRFYARKFVSNG